MTLTILGGGLLTTIQDGGRYGHQAEGVPVSGPMDPLALRCANLLAGNDEQTAALEATIIGPTIRFDAECVIALAGAELGATLDGVPFRAWHAALVRQGTVLAFRGAPSGCHAYIAVAGGIDVPLVLGSRSTYLRAAFGGRDGRAVRTGDVVAAGAPSARCMAIAASLRSASVGGDTTLVTPWGIGPSIRSGQPREAPLRLVNGAHVGLLAEESRDRLFGEDFRISSQSDRMGYRLADARLELRQPVELLSEGVTFGTMQLPPGGDPIVLMADRQTTGGYPRIGEVAGVDLPGLAQRRPGDTVRFRPIEVHEAQRLHAVREEDLRVLARAILLRYGVR